MNPNPRSDLAVWIEAKNAEAEELKQKWFSAPSGTAESKKAEIQYFDALARMAGACEFVNWLEERK